jgi:FlaA1/EpsC-like NDP-sugar epimerase
MVDTYQQDSGQGPEVESEKTITLGPGDSTSPMPYASKRTARPRRRETRSERVSVLAAKARAWMLFAILDGAVVVAGYGVAEVVTLRGRAPYHYFHHFEWFIILTLVVQLSTNRIFGLYGRIWRHAGVEEARNILLSCGTALLILLALYPFGRMLRITRVPIDVLPIGCILTIAGIGALRFHSRLLGWQRGTRRAGLRVGVIGSGDAGATAVREMLRNPTAGLSPVAVFDDDRRKHGLSVVGVPVVGSVDDLPFIVPRIGIEQVVLAVTAPTNALVERCLRAAETSGVPLKIVPDLGELVGSVTSAPASVRSAREPRIEDLLGRTQVTTDLAAVGRALEGRRVLVTGAGGSIGAEICRQIEGFNPASLVLLDRDETHLHEAIASLSGNVEQALVDVADRTAVDEIFDRYLPEVVFHAAAHKHVPILETHVMEAVVTNVIGSCNVIEAAARNGTERFVLISTDKAVRPVSVMGATKRVGERVLTERAPRGSSYCAVRFGNVLGSRGSVIPTFRRQIAAGGPVTVTDPEMARFFMSVEESVQLVLQASVLAQGGDIFMLKMGEPVRILDLAHRMIRLSGYNPGTDIAVEITGPRPGEKLREETRAPREQLLPTMHPSIDRLLEAEPGKSIEFDLAALKAAVLRRDATLARTLLFDLATEPPLGESGAYEKVDGGRSPMDKAVPA